MSKLEDFVLAVTRIVLAFLFVCHGAMKLFGAFGGHPMLHSPLFLTAGILEFAGGILIALGTLHAAGGLCPLRRDGRGLFPGTLSGGLLAHPESRRAGSALLLFLPVSGGARRRRPER